MNQLFFCHAYERMGFLLLVSISFLSMAAAQWVESSPEPVDERAVSAWEKEIAVLLEDSGPDSLTPTIFDPNTIKLEGWLSMGIEVSLAQRIEKYKAKGGQFRVAEDLKRIYGFPEEDYEQLEAFIRIEARHKFKPDSREKNKRANTITPWNFDPNEVSTGDLENMGLSPKAASTWVKFRQVVGGFSRPGQIEKIYGLDQDWWARWKTFAQWKGHSGTEESSVRLDINQASQEDWQQLRGIGPVLAGRIVKFRESLGGFHSPVQVGETFGLPDSTFQKLLPLLEIKDQSSIQKINLNQADVRSLARHPYINWKKAEIIVSYRKHHGPFVSLEDLLLTKVINEEELQKIIAYLEL